MPIEQAKGLGDNVSVMSSEARWRGVLWVAAPLLSVVALAGGGNDRQLADAAKKQDRTAVRALLTQKVNVNAPQADGATALHWAVHWNDLETVDLLIRAGARVNAMNDYGVAPLWLACANGSAAIVKKLIGSGADPNPALVNGETTLMRCAYTGNVEAVDALLAHGADVNAKEPARGQTPLMWAVAQRHPDVVRALIEYGADVHVRTSVRRELVGNGTAGPSEPGGGMEIEDGGFTALLFAAQQGDLESARFLLDAGADVNDTAADGSSVLVMASHSGHGNVAAFLLDKGADPNAARAGYTALHVAILRGNVDLVKALLAHGADPRAQVTRGTAMRRFAYQWVIPGAFIGATPFWLAARYAEVEIMHVLASSGADTQTALRDGTTPLMAAAGVGWSSVDRRGRSLGLEILAAEAERESRTLEAVKVALEAGGNVNAANGAGNTALHGAAAKRFTSVVQFLVDKGGNVDTKNNAGRTPAELLQRSKAMPPALP